MTDFAKLESKFDELKSLVLSKYDQTSEIKRLNDELNRVNEENNHEIKRLNEENNHEIKRLNDELNRVNEENKHEMKRLNREHMRLVEQNQQLFVQNQSLSEEVRQMRCERDKSIVELHDLQKKFENSYEKGKMFEEHGIYPILQQIVTSLPECELKDTRSFSKSGDYTIVSKDVDMTLNIEGKFYEKTILSNHIEQAIRDAENKNAHGSILIYKKLPNYCENGIYDMSTDYHNKFPQNSAFDRNMFIICTPESMQIAVCILMLRLQKKSYECPDEKVEFYENLVDFISLYADMVNPIMSAFNIEKLKILSEKGGHMASKLIADCNNVANCDKNQIYVQEKVCKLLRGLITKKPEKGIFVPKLLGIEQSDETKRKFCEISDLETGETTDVYKRHKRE